ncbi:MAG: hypothetical protein MUQ32_08740, partial [Chloroflexi bacterium]|nr:hypothetical protein [Chloroflexota bacterium]
MTLGAAVDAAEELDEAGGPDFWRWWIAQHDRDSDIVLAVGADGTALGVAGSYGTVTDTGGRAILWFEGHPDRLDLEA